MDRGPLNVGKPQPDQSNIGKDRHVSEGAFSGRSVSSPQRENRGVLASSILHPFTSAKNVYARHAYSAVEIELRADHQQLASNNTSREEKNVILGEIRERLGGDERLSPKSEKELLQMAGDKHLSPSDRLAILDALSTYFSNHGASFPDALLDGICAVMIEGVEGDENEAILMQVVGFVVGKESLDPPTERALKMLSKFAKSLQKCPDERMSPAVVLNVCGALDRLAKNPDFARNHGGALTRALVTVSSLYEKVASNEGVSAQDRMIAAKQLFAMGNESDYPREVSIGGHPLQKAASLMAGILSGINDPAERRAMAKELLLLDTRSVAVAPMGMRGESVDARAVFAECLIDIAKEDKQYAAEHKGKLGFLVESLLNPIRSDIEGLAFQGLFDVAFAKNEHLSLAERLNYEKSALDCERGITFKGMPDDVPEELRAFASTGGVVFGECVEKLKQEDIPFAERLEAFRMLESNGRIQGGYTIAARAKEACQGFLEAAFREENRGQLSAQEWKRLVVYSSNRSEALVRLVGLEGVSLNVKNVVDLGLEILKEKDRDAFFQLVLDRDDLNFDDRLYAIVEGSKENNEVCRLALSKLKRDAMLSETPAPMRMKIARALGQAGRLGNDIREFIDGIYLRLGMDPSVDPNIRIKAIKSIYRPLSRVQQENVAEIFVDELLSMDLSDVVKPAQIYMSLMQTHILDEQSRNRIIEHFSACARDSGDSRLQTLVPVLFGGLSPTMDLDSVLDQAMAVMDSDTYTLEEKYLLAFLPLSRMANEEKLQDRNGVMQKFLDLSAEIFADPSVLPEAFLSEVAFRLASLAVGSVVNALKLPGDSSYRELAKRIMQYSQNAGFMQRRAHAVVHNPRVASFSGDGKDTLRVRWSPAFIEKPLPKPDVPDVNYDDFKAWAAAYRAEVESNSEALEQMKLMTESGDLSFFMGDANRKEFETYLDPQRVEGSFVDPTALALRQIIAYANTLSDTPAEGEVISPRGLLFQQLLVNCRTCETGFMDAVATVARDIPKVAGADVSGVALSEAEMREQRKADALSDAYYQASVKRRQDVLDGDSVFTRTLAGNEPDERLNQPVHQSWVMGGLLGAHVGLRTEKQSFWVDPYARVGNNVNKTLYKMEPQDALDRFYEHYDVNREVAHFKDKWNEEMAADLKKSQDLQAIGSDISRLMALNGKEQLTAAEQEEKAKLEARDLQKERENIEARPSYGTFDKIQSLMGTARMGEIFDYDYDEDADEDIYTLNDRGVALILIEMGVLEKVE